MKSCKTPYLYKSFNHVYYFRFVIPERFRFRLCVHEIKRSLLTKHHEIARVRILKYYSIVEEIMSQNIHDQSTLRQKLNQIALEGDSRKTISLIAKYTDRITKAISHLQNFKDIEPLEVAVKQVAGEAYFLPAVNYWLKTANSYDDIVDVITFTSDAVMDANIDLDELGDINMFHRSLLAHQECFNEKYSNIYLDSSLAQLPESPTNIINNSPIVNYVNDSLTFSQAVDLFYSDNGYTGDYRYSKSDYFYEGVGVFNEMFPNVRLKDITPRMIKDFVKLINGLPKSRNKVCKYRKLNIWQQFELAASYPEDIISPKTIHRYLSLKKVFNHFKDSAWIDNSFESLFKNLRAKQLKGKKGNQNKRAYNDSELKIIFNGYAFVPNSKPDKTWLKENNPKAYDAIFKGSKTCTNIPTLRNKDYLFWVTLIALYSGCRANEVCQLRTDMIHQHEEGFYYFEIKSSDEIDSSSGAFLKAKNDSSERLVPLHPDLIDFGFLDFIEEQVGRVKRNNGKPVQIFRGLKWSKHNKNFSTDLTGVYICYRRALGVGLSNGLGSIMGSVDFHSFRRTFLRFYINNIESNDINIKRLKDVVGHKDDDVTTGIYAGVSELPNLYQDILKFDVSKLGLDLSHIKWSEMKREYY